MLLLLAAAVLWLFAVGSAKVPSGGAPSLSAKSAVLVDGDDGTVVYAKNEHEKLAIASTTKIMTSLLTLEEAKKNDRAVTITPEMIRVEGSSMYLHAGDRLTLSGLAAGMLLVSGNDAANSAAIAVGGSLDAFAAKMNAKAAALGMKDTHFVTPSGLDDAQHYSTAYDMALLAGAALRNPDFAKLACEKTAKVTFLNPPQTRTLKNHNKLLTLYAGCDGIKTGFTDKAGRCLVSSAQKNGVHLVAVTLNDPDDWKDHAALFDYGFSRLERHRIDDSAYRVTVPIVGGVKGEVQVRGTAGDSIVTDSRQPMTRSVELPRFVYAPVREGQVLGIVRYVRAGRTVAQTELLSAENVAQPPARKNWLQRLWEWMQDLFSFR